MSRGLRVVVTYDEADFSLLRRASQSDKFGVELGLVLDDDTQMAFERGVNAQWFTLVDVAPFGTHQLGASMWSALRDQPRSMRVFRLTEAGYARLAELKQTFRGTSAEPEERT
jgi:hypothetical protein